MKSSILPMIVSVLFLIGCNSLSKKSEDNKISTKTYENEFFSLEYPSNLTCHEEVNNDYVENPHMQAGYKVTIVDPSGKDKTRVEIVKSVIANLHMTAEQMRDLSVLLKEQQQSEDSDGFAVADTIAYIGGKPIEREEEFSFIKTTGVLDSLTFGQYPAAMSFSKLRHNESGDTVNAFQMVVLVDTVIYYLNGIVPENDDGTIEKKEHSILESIKFKK